jgi:hypothetical protein
MSPPTQADVDFTGVAAEQLLQQDTTRQGNGDLMCFGQAEQTPADVL